MDYSMLLFLFINQGFPLNYRNINPLFIFLHSDTVFQELIKMSNKLAKVSCGLIIFDVFVVDWAFFKERFWLAFLDIQQLRFQLFGNQVKDNVNRNVPLNVTFQI